MLGLWSHPCGGYHGDPTWATETPVLRGAKTLGYRSIDPHVLPKRFEPTTSLLRWLISIRINSLGSQKV